MARTSPPYLKVPNELWDVVFSYDFRGKDFLVLSIINKFFNLAVEPSLYSNFTWLPKLCTALPVLRELKDRDLRTHTRGRRRNHIELPREYFSHQTPYLLLQAILDSPRRAGYLKTVKILAPTSEVGVFWDSYHAREYGFSEAHFETCKKTIDQLPPAYHSYWIDGLYKGKLEVILGVLLLRLTGLENIEIRLRDVPATRSAVIYALSCPLASRPHHYRYPNVKTFKLTTDYVHGLPLNAMLAHKEEDIFQTYQPVPSIFNYKKLKNLSMTHCSPGNYLEGRLNSAMNLTKLTLRDSCINENQLATFLAATPHLEDLDVELFYDDTIPQYLDCVKLKSALLLVHKTLKRLVLDITVHFDLLNWSLPWAVQGPMGDMKAFTALRYLDIPLKLYATEIYQASQSASLESWSEQRIDYLGQRMPDGLEWFGIRVCGKDSMSYEPHYHVQWCVEAYLRNSGVKRIVYVEDPWGEDYDTDGN
ncbi:uncharacterized protein RCO7_00651 [Rhynchosporium graminicola]|uniref:F-box domain-containing protein n=1 Tax=Rhynchosporium graminicola TaxID=2792576 RepID=A0A1E1LSH5_9HELO|nr:uncharacterized protein RCO7_00651 [Rhynchosporium commune]